MFSPFLPPNESHLANLSATNSFLRSARNRRSRRNEAHPGFQIRKAVEDIVKRLVAAVTLGLLVASGVVGTHGDAWAVADPLSFTVDCTNATTLNSSTIPAGFDDARRMTVGTVTDTFTISAEGGACTVTPTNGVIKQDSNDSVDVHIINAGSSVVYEVTGSGSYTIAPASGDPVVFAVDADDCDLDGAGVATAPFLVGTAANFELVGAGDCGLDANYLQTAAIAQLDTYNAALVVAGVFTGIYDGDHYQLSFSSEDFDERPPLFETLGVNGVIKRLTLSGNLKSDLQYVAPLVDQLNGGTISEIDSRVDIETKHPEAVVGGLAARSVNEGGSSLPNSIVMYSKFDGSIDWFDPGSNLFGPVIGGLVGMQSLDGDSTDRDSILEIRDSYSRARITYDSSDLDADDPDSKVYAGGIVGSDGFRDLDSTNGSAGDEDIEIGGVRLIRTYFAGSFANTCEGTDEDCNLDGPVRVFNGGLMGLVVADPDVRGVDLIVSSFWLSTSATNSVGLILLTNGTPANEAQPLAYTAATPGLPEAAHLSATMLRTLSSFQSKESGSLGIPSGSSDLAIGDSTDGTLTEQDYRWAIEGGNIGTFVASSYGDVDDYLTRELYDDTSIVQSYRREGAGDLGVHGGEDSRTVTGYPALGRVWEICSGSNDGYPFLVWEELSCTGGSSGTPSSPGDDRDETPTASTLGLTEAEYAAYLASGLTLDQFLARRLAATGPHSQLLWFAGLSAVALAGMGAVLVKIGRRDRTLVLTRPR